METNIVKVKLYDQNTGELTQKEYTYFTVDRMRVGDITMVPVRDTSVKGIVTAVDVPEIEIEKFADRVKTIPLQALPYEGVTLDVVEEKPVAITQTVLQEVSPQAEPFEKSENLIIVERETTSLDVEVFNLKEISTPDQQTQVERWLSTIRIKLQDLEKKRFADVKKPNEYVKWINSKYREGSDLLKKMEQHCLTIGGAYRQKKAAEQATEQARLNAIAQAAADRRKAAEEAARKKEEEARKAEEEARRKQEEAQKAEEEARARAAQAKDEEEKRKAEAEAQAAREAAQAADEAAKAADEEARKQGKIADKKEAVIPVVIVHQVEGLAKTVDTGEAKNIWGTEWDFEIFDLEKFMSEGPRWAMIPNEKYIRAYGKLNQKKAIMPGIRFFEKPKAQVRRSKVNKPED